MASDDLPKHILEFETLSNNWNRVDWINAMLKNYLLLKVLVQLNKSLVVLLKILDFFGTKFYLLGFV